MLGNSEEDADIHSEELQREAHFKLKRSSVSDPRDELPEALGESVWKSQLNRSQESGWAKGKYLEATVILMIKEVKGVGMIAKAFTGTLNFNAAGHKN